MYRLAISRDFIAQHFLVGGDWGDENRLHSHHYRVELLIEGQELNEHGYLVDIVELEQALVSVIAQFRDQTLNDQVVFGGANPSIERFARILHDDLSGRLALGDARLGVTLWENDRDFAGYCP
ncbi:MAG: 6-carboxytetrahydropterin synthase [Gammaproteobacteria bacterium]|nr:6-carboxytetrahydropterin synthase [Gammaproteobacteria bacterium]